MSFGLGAGRKVTVVGAGFSGLVSAYALVRAGFRVTVIEATAKAGGLIQTLKLEDGLVETAANALLNSTAVEELFAATGVEMVGTLKASKKRYIFKNGRARRWPLGVLSTLQVLGFLFRYLFRRSTVAPRRGESAQAWATRVMGADASAYLAEAALQGIYAGDPKRMSASLIFSRMFGNKRESVLEAAGMSNSAGGLGESSESQPSFLPNSRSLLPHDSPHRVRPKSAKRKGSVAPAHGMGELIEGLVTYLKSKGVDFQFEKSVSFESAPDHPHVVATPAYAASALLKGLSVKRSSALSRVEYSPVVTTTAFFEGTDARSKGFGVLFPPIEKRKALGVLKNNFIFRNRVTRGYSETWIQGGALAEQSLVNASDEEILKRLQSERGTSFRREDRVLSAQTTRWPKGIPHYTVDLEETLRDLQGFDQNILLMGNYLGEIGLAKILERALRLPLQISNQGRWASQT